MFDRTELRRTDRCSLVKTGASLGNGIGQSGTCSAKMNAWRLRTVFSRRTRAPQALQVPRSLLVNSYLRCALAQRYRVFGRFDP